MLTVMYWAITGFVKTGLAEPYFYWAEPYFYKGGGE